MRKGNPLTNSPKTDPIRKEFPQSATPLRNPIFTLDKAVVCTGFAVRPAFGEIYLVPMEGLRVAGQGSWPASLRRFVIPGILQNQETPQRRGRSNGYPRD